MRKKVQPKGKTGRADMILVMINKLYSIERELKDASDKQRFIGRQEMSLRILAQLKSYLDITQSQVTPRSALGRVLIQLELAGTLRGGRFLPIGSNQAECAIKPFFIGHKAWLFSDAPNGVPAGT